MASAVERTTRNRKYVPGAPTARSILVSLALSASMGAFAASDTLTDCDRMGRELRSLAVSAGTLATEVVDLSVGAEKEGLAGNFDPTEPDTEIQSPVLYLAPRLDTIVRDVFGAVAVDSGTSPSAIDHEPSVTDAEVAPRPLADSATEPGDANAERHESTPQVQRQMYRTDI